MLGHMIVCINDGATFTFLSPLNNAVVAFGGFAIPFE